MDGYVVEVSTLGRGAVFAAVDAERERQDAKWGGAAHDDRHTEGDWRDFLYSYVQCPNIDDRERFVKIAALAVAALESIDRKAT